MEDDASLETSIGAIILAAGGSSRLGRPKQLLRFNGQTLLRHAIEAILAAGCSPVVVVTGAHAEAIEAEIEAEAAGLQVLVARNESWQQGLSTSVRAGIEALRPGQAQAAVLLPCDQPLLNAGLLSQLMQKHREGASIVVCEYAGAWGVPMLFERGLWAQLQVLEGDRGAQKVARANAGLVQCVAFESGALDVDTDEDYQKLLGARP